MPTYMWHASYTPEGAKGLAKEGGTKRRDAVKQMVEAAGGRLHAFYFAIGKDDVVGITEYPDQAAAIGTSLAVRASGMIASRTIVLVTPEERDAAIKKAVAFRPPGA